MKARKFRCLALIKKIYLKQWIWWLSSWLLKIIIKKTVILKAIYKGLFVKHIVLIFSLIRTTFLSIYKNIVLISNQLKTRFLISSFSVYKMVDSEYSTDNNKSSKISIRTTMKNPKMLKFFPVHLKTKKCVSMQLKNYLS